MSLPYQSNGNWFVSLGNGGTTGPFATEQEALDLQAANAARDEITTFVRTLVSLIIQMYGIQKKILILLDTFAKKLGPALVMAAMVWNATHPDDQKVVPSKLSEMAAGLVGADFSGVPGMNAEKFALVMQTCFDIMTGVDDAKSAVMYSTMPLVSD